MLTNPMSESTVADPFDDLPNRTSEHVGEDESKQRFGDFFKDPYFLVRGEAENDYGVDMVVEALNEGGSPTNFRAHAQLKASGKDPNKDGSYSYAVARTNLNYLLNHPASVYVFYARGVDTLYCRTAESVFEEREASGKDWQTQDSLTIRFTEVVTESVVRQMRDDVIRLNRYLRRFRLGLITQAISLESKVVFDPETDSVTDLGAVIQQLTERGLAMVAAGHGPAVDRMLQLVSEVDRTADIWLVSAYLNYSRGLVYDAGNDADRARSLEASTDDKRALAEYVSATARFAQGHITADVLDTRMAKIETAYPDSVTALYSKLDRLQRAGVRGDDEVVNEIEAVATEIRGRGPSFASMSIQADTLLLQARYFRVQRIYMDQVASYRISKELGIDRLTERARAQAAHALVEEQREVYIGFEALFQRAQEHGDQRLLAEAIYAFELCRLQDRMAFEKTAPKDPSLAKAEQEMTDASLERLHLAASLFEDSSMPDGALRARMLEVDFLYVAGRKADARKLAENVAKLAAKLGLGTIAARAMDVASGKSPLDLWDSIPSLGE